MALNVLIVDDSAAIRKILLRVLSQANLCLGKVYEANNGREALDKLRTESIGLVLSDINMPNMDGIELLSSMKASDTLKDVPIIIVTSEGSRERVMQALKLGAAGYVRKPFTPEQIKDKLIGIV